MLESALSRILEGRYVSETVSDSLRTDYPELYAKVWSQLQMVLKKMLSMSFSAGTNKNSSMIQSTPISNRFLDAGKLRELYKTSLKVL